MGILENRREQETALLESSLAARNVLGIANLAARAKCGVRRRARGRGFLGATNRFSWHGSFLWGADRCAGR